MTVKRLLPVSGKQMGKVFIKTGVTTQVPKPPSEDFTMQELPETWGIL